MRVCRDEANETIYVCPDADLVSVEAQAMRKELEGCIRQAMKRVVLDLARVRTIDNAGLEAIVEARYRICDSGGELVIKNASRDLKDLFSLVRHDRRLIVSRR